jgi:hypothetical protein
MITATTTTIACTSTRSCCCRAWIISRPMPGHANTVSTTTVKPASMRAYSKLLCVRTGTIELRKAWWVMRYHSDRPLASAVSM